MATMRYILHEKLSIVSTSQHTKLDLLSPQKKVTSNGRTMNRLMNQNRCIITTKVIFFYHLMRRINNNVEKFSGKVQEACCILLSSLLPESKEERS